MIRSGEMRHQITIQVRSASQDADTGEQVNTWSTFATRRAAVERTTGSEIEASAQRNGRVQTVFRIRFLSGVTPAMRISFNSKVFNILSVVDQRGLCEELILTCEELFEVTP